ncbi:MAG: Peptidylprolyl isomerase [Verrucomicrobiaceae bacterium]|nr:Peptidylprolyl isomerase [Verrucomicrobiaceae bacterium]
MHPWFASLLIASTTVSFACAQEKPATPPAPAADKTATSTHDPMTTVPRDKVSYNMGRTTAKNMVDVGFKPDINAYMEGVKSALEGAAPKFTEEEMAEAVKKFKAALPSDAQLKRTKAIKSGKEYLATNGKRKEVTTTASGLQYEVLKAADGPKPQATDIVKVHYHGTLVDGTVFDSSVDRKAPISFRLDGVIPGWTEGVLLMNKGSKYKFVIPDKLAYGDQGQGAVGPNETLIFEVELLDINPPEAAK